MLASLVRDWVNKKYGGIAEEVNVSSDGIVELKKVRLGAEISAIKGCSLRVVSGRASAVRFSTFSREFVAEDLAIVLATSEVSTANDREALIQLVASALRSAAEAPLMMCGPAALGLTGRDWRVRLVRSVARFEAGGTSFGMSIDKVDLEPARREARGWRREAGSVGMRMWASSKDAPFSDDDHLVAARCQALVRGGRAIAVTPLFQPPPQSFLTVTDVVAKAHVTCADVTTSVCCKRSASSSCGVFRWSSAILRWTPGRDVEVRAWASSALGDEASMFGDWRIPAFKVAAAIESGTSFRDCNFVISDAEPEARDGDHSCLLCSLSKTRATIAIRLDGTTNCSGHDAHLEIDISPPFVFSPSADKIAAVAACLFEIDITLTEARRRCQTTGRHEKCLSTWDRLKRGLSLQAALSFGTAREDHSAPIVCAARRRLESSPPPCGLVSVTIVALVANNAVSAPTSRRLAVRLSQQNGPTKLTRHASLDDYFLEDDECDVEPSPDEHDDESIQHQPIRDSFEVPTARFLAEDYEAKFNSIVLPVLDTFDLPARRTRVAVVDLDAYQIVSGAAELAYTELDLAALKGVSTARELSPMPSMLSDLFPSKSRHKYTLKLAVAKDDSQPLACAAWPPAFSRNRTRCHSYRDRAIKQQQQQVLPANTIFEASVKADLIRIDLPDRALETFDVELKLTQAENKIDILFAMPRLEACDSTYHYEGIRAEYQLPSGQFQADLGKTSGTLKGVSRLADALAAAAPIELLEALLVAVRRCVQHFYRRPANRLADLAVLDQLRTQYGTTPHLASAPPLSPLSSSHCASAPARLASPGVMHHRDSPGEECFDHPPIASRKSLAPLQADTGNSSTLRRGSASSFLPSLKFSAAPSIWEAAVLATPTNGISADTSAEIH